MFVSRTWIEKGAGLMHPVIIGHYHRLWYGGCVEGEGRQVTVSDGSGKSSEVKLRDKSSSNIGYLHDESFTNPKILPLNLEIEKHIHDHDDKK